MIRLLVRSMFGGELGGLLDARSDAVTSLVAECVAPRGRWNRRRS